jgi:3-keto-5-aminohexanoate cleavage enzyme
MQRDAVIIEVGLNEAVMRDQAVNVAYSPAECAADATACADAGAAIVHWHARDPVTGASRLADTTSYAEALASMPTDRLLAYPTYPIDVETLDERLGHCFELVRRQGMELVPVDVASVNTVIWDATTHSFPFPSIDPAVVSNPLSFTLAALERITELGVWPTFGTFDVGGTRLLALLAEAGILREPVVVKLFLSDAWAVGPFPTTEAIDFHLAQLPPTLDVEWLVVPYTISDPQRVERLGRHAIERGGGVRVGIGDNPAADPDATNAQWVERAARWADEAGRPIASADDVRRRLAGASTHVAGQHRRATLQP